MTFDCVVLGLVWIGLRGLVFDVLACVWLTFYMSWLDVSFRLSVFCGE